MPANVRNYGDQGGAGQHIGGTLTVESAGILDIATGGILKQDGVAFDKLIKVKKVALAALDTAGGVLSWANPEAATIIISRVLYNVTTKSTGACTVDTGVAANGTTSGDNLMDGLDVGAAAGLFSNIKNAGTNGKADQLMTSGQFLTGSMATGAAAGLVGFAYIYYHRI